MGHSTKEIAELMGMQQGAVLTRLHRARIKLKDEVEKEAAAMTTSGKNMNCEEYKEAIAADPNGDRSKVARSTLLRAQSCAAFTSGDAGAQCEDCESALAIDVPDLAMPELPAD